jgi:hypothetical protein
MRSESTSNANDRTMARQVQAGLERLERDVQLDDDDSTNEIMSRLNALSMEEAPTRSRLENVTSHSPRLRMPQPRSLSFHETASPPSGIFQGRSRTPEKRSHSPLSYASPPQSSAYHTPRSYSSGGGQTANAPLMIRAHSSPTCLSPTFGPLVPRSSSPLRSPKRVRSPFRHSIAEDSGYATSAVALSPEIGSISEDAELEITPRSHLHSNSFSNTTSALPSLSFPRPLRRRPASPLRSLNSSRASSVPASPHLSAIPSSSSSTSSSGGRFNESFAPDLPYYYQNGGRSLSLSSSMPSTPTSVRSRSPSISSLETIPDSPDAEDQAIQQDSKERDERKRLWEQLYGSTPAASSGSERASAGARSGFGSRDKRKRWSVCGAEKRSDLNLETIWED